MRFSFHCPFKASVRTSPSFVWCLMWPDRKSTRLNSSHRCISYAVFCLKKKKEIRPQLHQRRGDGDDGLQGGHRRAPGGLPPVLGGRGEDLGASDEHLVRGDGRHARLGV